MNDFETYAAERADTLSAADDRLRPHVSFALKHYGPPGWSDPILNEAETLFGEVYAAEGGDKAKFDDALSAFTETMSDFLALSTAPSTPVDDAQVERITTWASTFTGNAATTAASGSDDKMVWTTMRDGDVRPTHRAADGQVRTVGDKFDVGGAALRFPADPEGPLDEVLGCRCLLLREGGTTMAARTFAVDTIDDVEAERDSTLVEDMPDGDPSDYDFEAPTWHGVIAPEGKPSGDGRSFAANSLSTRDMPLPLRWTRADVGEHGGAVVVGNILHAWRGQDGLIRASGTFRTDSPEANEVVGMVATDMLRGVSVDLDDIAFEIDEAMNDAGENSVTLTKGRISAATLVDIPAFAEVFIALGDWDPAELETSALIASCGCTSLNDDGTGLTLASDPPSEDPAEPEFGAGDPVTYDDGATGVVVSVAPPLATVQPDAGGDPIEVPIVDLAHNDPPEDNLDPAPGYAAGTHDGPGWLTNPRDTQRLRSYWTKGAGAAKIRWGVPGDFNRCRAQLGKYVDPLFLAGTCANLHKEALGTWPGRERGGVASSDTAPFNLVASANRVYDHTLFERVPLDDPRVGVIVEGDHVFGYIAQWGVCHIGVQGVCTEAPPSETDYWYYATGVVDTDKGQVKVGQITMDTGHADLTMPARIAVAHYDNTGAAVADVAVGDDTFGIWFSGALRPEVTDQQRHGLRAAGRVSGDWRRQGGNLELVAALAVNVPGFPIPHTAIAASGGVQTALVAAGIVPVTDQEPTLVEAVKAALVQIDAERARSTAVAAARATIRAARLDRARAALRG